MSPSTAAWNFAVNMAAPFFVIYMLKRIGLSLFLVTVLMVTSQLTNILFLRLWGRLADRYSNKSVMGLSGSLLWLSVLAWCFTTMPERYFLTLPILFAIHVFSGMATAGVSLSSANIALKLAPQGSAHSYMTLFGLAGAITGATAPLIGGLLGDFFAVRELAVTIDWSSPGQQFAVYALNFRALDFVFLIACLAGFFALSRLAMVKEEGEVTEREVRDELVDEVVSSFRSITSIAGVRRMAFFPVRQLTGSVNRTGLEEG